MPRKHSRTRHCHPAGVAGTMLYAPNGAGDFIIGRHDKDTPAMDSTARLNPSTGDGVLL